MTPEARRRLAELGFAPPGFTQNYSRIVRKSMLPSNEAANLLIEALYDIYGFRDQQSLRYKPGEDVPENGG